MQPARHTTETFRRHHSDRQHPPGAGCAQVAAHLVEGGYATYDEIAFHLSTLAAGAIDISTPPLISAWGRKPADR
jgi:hypothetical protein